MVSEPTLFIRETGEGRDEAAAFEEKTQAQMSMRGREDVYVVKGMTGLCYSTVRAYAVPQIRI